MDSRDGDYGIYSQQYDGGGTTLGPNFRVDDDAGGSEQWFPSISMSEGGDFGIVWEDYRENSADIYCQRYEASGAPIGPNFRVDDDITESAQWNPVVALSEMGGCVVVWEDYRDGESDIYCQRYDVSGNALGSNFMVNEEVGGEQTYPGISMSGVGEFAVVWMDSRNGDSDVYCQRYDVLGAAVGVNVLVNDDQGDSPQRNPAIAHDGQGAFAVAWEDQRSGNYDIYCQRYDAAGNAFGGNFRVNDDGGSGSQLAPSICVDAAGNIVVAWRDYRDQIHVFAQRYNADGSPDGGNWQVSSGPLGPLSYRVGTACNGDRLVVTWDAAIVPGHATDVWCSGWQFYSWNLIPALDGAELVLQWAPVPGADEIRVYRSHEPFFDPDIASGTNLVAVLPGNSVEYSSDYGIADHEINAFYRLVAWDIGLGELIRSGSVGEFDFESAIPP
jgi:hypothetical protein